MTGARPTVAFVATLALMIFGAFATASAQPADIIAVNKAFQDHYSRGNYSAAQIEATKLERLVKARFGADHAYYAVALNKLALAYWKEGRYPPPSLQAVDRLGLWDVAILSPSAAHQLPSDQPTSCASLLVHVCAGTCPAQFC